MYFRPVFKMMFKYMCLVLFITWYQLADCHPAGSDVSEIDSMIDKVRLFWWFTVYLYMKNTNLIQ